VTLYIEGFSHFVTSMNASIASGWNFYPLENAALARRTPNATVTMRVVSSIDMLMTRRQPDVVRLCSSL
jgi:hypothetical protein